MVPSDPSEEARRNVFEYEGWQRRSSLQVARHPRRLSTISGVYSLHITAGGDAVRGYCRPEGSGHPCLSGAKTVWDALRTLPANVASGTLMPSVSASLTWGVYPPPRFGVKVSDDLIVVIGR